MIKSGAEMAHYQNFTGKIYLKPKKKDLTLIFRQACIQVPAQGRSFPGSVVPGLW
jgi:hypothetical protein